MYANEVETKENKNCLTQKIHYNIYINQVCQEEKQLSLNHVSTWDFSTLYTSLPHAQLKKQLHDLLERVFNTKGKSFIAPNNFRTFWTISSFIPSSTISWSKQ